MDQLTNHFSATTMSHIVNPRTTYNPTLVDQQMEKTAPIAKKMDQKAAH